MFEDVVCVDLSGAPYGRLIYTNITSSELSVGPSLGRLEIMDEGLIMLLPHFFRVLSWDYVPPICWCLLGLRWARCEVERKGNFKRTNMDSSLSLIFPSSSSFSFSYSFSSLPCLIIFLTFSDSSLGLFLFSFWPFLILLLVFFDCKQPSMFIWIFL